jgi:hypothetical protein
LQRGVVEPERRQGSRPVGQHRARVAGAVVGDVRGDEGEAGRELGGGEGLVVRVRVRRAKRGALRPPPPPPPSHLPHVQVVHARHPRHARQRGLHLGRAGAGAPRALQQNVADVAHEADRGEDDEDGKQEGERGVQNVQFAGFGPNGGAGLGRGEMWRRVRGPGKIALPPPTPSLLSPRRRPATARSRPGRAQTRRAG